jgi:hypothetical protein
MVDGEEEALVVNMVYTWRDIFKTSVVILVVWFLFVIAMNKLGLEPRQYGASTLRMYDLGMIVFLMVAEVFRIVRIMNVCAQALLFKASIKGTTYHCGSGDIVNPLVNASVDGAGAVRIGYAPGGPLGTKTRAVIVAGGQEGDVAFAQGASRKNLRWLRYFLEEYVRIYAFEKKQNSPLVA